MRLAYLAHTYPYASHAFIRREIRKLEELGHEVRRCTLRADPDAVVDAADRSEIERTFVVVDKSHWRLASNLMLALGAHPWQFIRACRAAFAVAPLDGRRLRHAAAYLLEAAVLSRELERHRISHIHAHFGTHPAAVAHVARALGGPSYSLTVHGPEEFLPEFRESLRLKIRGSAFTVAISTYCADQLTLICDDADRAKVTVVRCGVDASFPSGASRVDPGSTRIVCVGRLSARKGQLRLLDAAARVRREGAKFELLLVGDGELRGEIEARVDELELEDCVELRGWADEAQVRGLVSSARGLVVPSDAEGLPVVIVEALALGRPVIASQVAAISELVRNGETGWLVSPDLVDDLAVALRELLATPAERLDEMGARGRELVLERHSTEREVAHLERLLELALAT